VQDITSCGPCDGGISGCQDVKISQVVVPVMEGSQVVVAVKMGRISQVVVPVREGSQVVVALKMCRISQVGVPVMEGSQVVVPIKCSLHFVSATNKCACYKLVVSSCSLETRSLISSATKITTLHRRKFIYLYQTRFIMPSEITKCVACGVADVSSTQTECPSCGKPCH